MGSKRFWSKPATIGNQVIAMKRCFPDFQLIWNKGIATWIGTLEPIDLSERYKIKIQYNLQDVPKVWVISPELIDRHDGQKIPHIYPGKRLCLYLPGSGEWRRDMLIAETIVLWASLWLYYYEVWHATGEWLGGGVHPSITGRALKIRKKCRFRKARGN